MHKRITTAISTGLLAIGITGGVAMAQQPSTQPQPKAPMTVPTPDYSDAQLERFVSASEKVAMISQEYTPKLQASKDETTQKKIFEEADQKMVKAVHDEGMTVDQFNGINQSLQQDPNLVKRVQKIAQ
ncbi:DUF4168 domain-containing protein [Pollutimonas harenae]|uniref:DUF4168 domain-containing protein n=1 Tax=Pollutimonas harenae TaxID=657015 RepID=A0A853H0P0_9BURK|nr:DUF4168 domain-containing protein [Pollutimonas harenae]NYT85600.1 DUF4168 domain-containing protein [Pollutimonas harenae]TEA70681.1 DUF4168 domain-containing protein [Pollutimonas harenae]